LSQPTEPEVIVDSKEETNSEQAEEVDLSVENAVAAYRKIKEFNKELTDKEIVTLDKECQVIEDRKTVEVDPLHESKEISVSGKIKVGIGPPVLTRFEKARIMGARALQLSLGAPAFLEIKDSMHTSLDIAMAELEQKVIPITIRRTLPNGDYQNIPIDHFVEY